MTDEGTALALLIEISPYLDPELTEHDKAIVLRKIKERVSPSPSQPQKGEK